MYLYEEIYGEERESQNNSLSVTRKYRNLLWEVSLFYYYTDLFYGVYHGGREAANGSDKIFGQNGKGEKIFFVFYVFVGLNRVMCEKIANVFQINDVGELLLKLLVQVQFDDEGEKTNVHIIRKGREGEGEGEVY